MIVTTGIEDQPPSNRARVSLYIGGIAAILASICHLSSFMLITLGLNKSNVLYVVTLADWARPYLIFIALIALFISYRHIWHMSFAYGVGIDSQISRAKVTDKVFFLFIVMLVISVLMLPYLSPCTE